MKESKFIELLNLYVDHEISAEETALLEAEIEQNPARRQVYRQYCQIQKACTVLAHDFRGETPVAPGNVVAFPVVRRHSRAWAYAGGLLAAAACVAFVFVSRNRPAADHRPAADSPTVQLAVQTDIPIPAKMLSRSSVAARPALQTVFAGLVNEAPESDAALASANLSQLDWMNQVQLQRLPVEELRFESRPNSPQDARIFRSRQPLKAQVEMTAFQFQR